MCEVGMVPDTEGQLHVFVCVDGFQPWWGDQSLIYLFESWYCTLSEEHVKAGA